MSIREFETAAAGMDLETAQARAAWLRTALDEIDRMWAVGGDDPDAHGNPRAAHQHLERQARRYCGELAAVDVRIGQLTGSRSWTPWTASLAWGEVLVSSFQARHEQYWTARPGVSLAHVTVVVGLAVQSVAPPSLLLGYPRERITPHLLGAVRLDGLERHLGFPEGVNALLRFQDVGPARSADQLGLDHYQAVRALYREDALGFPADYHAFSEFADTCRTLVDDTVGLTARRDATLDGVLTATRQAAHAPMLQAAELLFGSHAF